MAWPIALVLTIVGAALVVLGFAVFGKIEPTDSGTDSADFSSGFMQLVAFVLIVPGWVIYLIGLARGRSQRQHAGDGVPAELAEPPSTDDPAVVGTVVNRGTPSGRAVAGTVLGLAHNGALSITEHGPQLVIDLAPNARASSTTDQLVLDALWARADERGHVVAPPLWPGRPSWWSDYVKDARARAMTAGLVESRIPFVGLMTVTIFTVVGLSLIFFWYLAAFVGFILLANGLPHLIARASGHRLTARGEVVRKQWLAFGRYIRAHRSLRDVGASGVAMWGPNLVYGVLVGEGDRAAAQLAPDVGRDRLEPAVIEYERTIEL